MGAQHRVREVRVLCGDDRDLGGGHAQGARGPAERPAVGERAGVDQGVAASQADARQPHALEPRQLADDRARRVRHQLGNAGGARGVVDHQGLVVVPAVRPGGGVPAYLVHAQRPGRGAVQNQGHACGRGKVGALLPAALQHIGRRDEQSGTEPGQQCSQRLARQVRGQLRGNGADAHGRAGQQVVVPVIVLDDRHPVARRRPGGGQPARCLLYERGELGDRVVGPGAPVDVEGPVQVHPGADPVFGTLVEQDAHVMRFHLRPPRMPGRKTAQAVG